MITYPTNVAKNIREKPTISLESDSKNLSHIQRKNGKTFDMTIDIQRDKDTH